MAFEAHRHDHPSISLSRDFGASHIHSLLKGRKTEEGDERRGAYSLELDATESPKFYWKEGGGDIFVFPQKCVGINPYVRRIKRKRGTAQTVRSQQTAPFWNPNMLAETRGRQNFSRGGGKRGRYGFLSRQTKQGEGSRIATVSPLCLYLCNQLRGTRHWARLRRRKTMLEITQDVQ